MNNHTRTSSLLDEVTKAFLRVEEDLDLMNETMQGVRFWERIRFGVYRRVKASMGFHEVQHGAGNPLPVRGWRIAKNSFIGLTTRNPIRAESPDIVFVGHPRRKKTASGAWEDIYCDPLLGTFDRSVAVLEPPWQDTHRSPPVTESLYYLDHIIHAPRILNHLQSKPILSDRDIKRLCTIDDALRYNFNENISIKPIVQGTLQNHKTTVPLFKELLGHLSPKVIILVASYGKESLIEAAQGLEIPVVELQHGVMHPYHMGYHFPGRSKRMFPDYVFTWGEAWHNDISFPIPAENLIPVGSAHMSDCLKRYGGLQKQDEIVFISQPGAGNDLSKLAVDLAPNSEYEVVYKLHPSEVDNWMERYPWLKGSNLRIENGNLHKILSKSKVQIGHSSSALFEGIGYGLQTMILKTPGHEIVSTALRSAGATFIETAEDVTNNLTRGTAPAKRRKEEWFTSDPRGRFNTAIEDIIETAA